MKYAVLFLLVLMSHAVAADWVLEIQPEHVNVPFDAITVGGKVPLYASMKNTSAGPVQLWKDWCSWGYFNLGFHIIRADGKTFDLARSGGDWTWNFPDPVLVKSGEAYVWKTLDKTFVGFPPDWKDGEKVKLVAIYTWTFGDLDRKMAAQEDQVMEKAEATTLEKLKSTNPDAAAAYLKSFTTRKTRYELLAAAWTGRIESAPYEVTLYRGTK